MASVTDFLRVDEQVVKVVWPSIAAWPLGRWIGRVWGGALARGPVVAFFAGFFLAPLAALVYFWRLRPKRCRRYLVTNGRILVLEGILGRVVEEAAWSQITRIEIVTLPGQAALRAGDVHIYEGDRIVLRLPGVSLVENFVRVCRRTQQACLMVASIQKRRAS